MENFHNVIAPVFLSFYAKKSSFFYTDVISTVSNYEYRFNYSGSINKYHFESAKLSSMEINILKDFFNARNGKIFSFWFFDREIKRKVRFNNDFIEYKVNCDGSFTLKNLEIIEVSDE
jgi:hypothetical protein